MGSYWNQLTWNQSGPLNVSLRLNEYAQALVSERAPPNTLNRKPLGVQKPFLL